MDNVFLIRDITDLCICYNVHIGIVSLDQDKTFDWLNCCFFLRSGLLGLVMRLCLGLGSLLYRTVPGERGPG